MILTKELGRQGRLPPLVKLFKMVVTGLGTAIHDSGNFPDVTPWLRSKKMRKFMGKQDQLAVIAASKAAQDAELTEQILRERTGIYLCVGFIPFERSDIEPIAKNSIENGRFSPALFSTKGFDQVNPLLTFRCLPNMPIFHVSLNLGIQGPYFITYPGIGQFYAALEQAVAALQSGEVDAALVGGVSDQNNFLVEHHLKRLGIQNKPQDAAGFICLQRNASDAQIELLEYEIKYEPDSSDDHAETFCAEDVQFYGAASLIAMLSEMKSDEARHRVRTRDGITASSRWRILRALQSPASV